MRYTKEKYGRRRWLEIRFGYTQLAAVLQASNSVLILSLYLHISAAWSSIGVYVALGLVIISAFLITGRVYRKKQLEVDNVEGNEYLLREFRKIVKEELEKASRVGPDSNPE